jgi:hypothetical protein
LAAAAHTGAIGAPTVLFTPPLGALPQTVGFAQEAEEIISINLLKRTVLTRIYSKFLSWIRQSYLDAIRANTTKLLPSL